MASQFCWRLVVASLLLMGANSIVAAAPAAATGDLWQVTSKMSMDGMPMEMPAQVNQVCAAKVWTRPPGGNDQHHCTRTDFNMSSGGTATWTEQCENPPMTGHGEITRQSVDDYSGWVKFESAQGNMTLTLTGHRTGDCDNPN